MPDKALQWMRLLRGRCGRVALQTNACCAAIFSPQQREENVALAGPQSARRGKRQDDSAKSGRGDGGNGCLLPSPTARAVVSFGHGPHLAGDNYFGL